MFYPIPNPIPNPNHIPGHNCIAPDTISYHNLYKILSGGTLKHRTLLCLTCIHCAQCHVCNKIKEIDGHHTEQCKTM